MPLPDLARPRLMELFHSYTMIGGMPEVVSRYLKTTDLSELVPVYQGLLTAFMDDVGKYARNATMARLLRHAIETAPLSAGTRITFRGFGNSNYRSREMGEALRTLERAMLVTLAYPTTSCRPPMMPDRKKSPRLHFLDTGLVNYAAGLQGQFFGLDDLHSLYRGIVVEHIVGQQLAAADCRRPATPRMWVRERAGSNAEVDYVHQHRNCLLPIEVKAGKSGALRSLHQFIDRTDHGHAIRFNAGPLSLVHTKTPAGKAYRLLTLPFFLAGQLGQYAEWLTTAHWQDSWTCTPNG